MLNVKLSDTLNSYLLFPRSFSLNSISIGFSAPGELQVYFTSSPAITYLSDIIKGRRNPPDKKYLEIIANELRLDADERDEMYDLAGRERDEAAPDLPGYIMDENLPHVRVALRKANKKGLGDDFWKRVADEIDKNGGADE